ncbi:SLAM family member 6-like isoform X5 [Pyxicephalus adspersus]|uniref:SLAM family member 6-like isoform X5 n=1 Tax=Pyxicephalus adspersus TaxID=30357 RepID=UPI003B5C3438
MRHLFIHSLLMFLLQTYVNTEEPCAERNITGAVGGDITFHVGHTGVRAIPWTFVGIEGAIATTIPGQPPDTLNIQFEGRLNSTSDGSLTITKLKQEDQGTYRAQFGKQKCFYHLTVFSNLTDEDITISYSVINNFTCEMNLTCSVNKSNVNITWRAKIRDILVTQNIVNVPSSDNDFTYQCTAKNPISVVSKSVQPWEYCKLDKTPEEKSLNRSYIYIFISFAVVGFLCHVLLVVLAWQRILRCRNKNKEPEPKRDTKKKYNVKDKEERAKTEPTTAHPQMNQDRSTTLYATVQNVKNRNKQQTLPEEQNTDVSKPQIESFYELVQTPKDIPNIPIKKISPEGANGSPVESCYEMVNRPMDTRNQKTSPKGVNGSPVESCYAVVTHPMSAKPTKKNCLA